MHTIEINGVRYSLKTNEHKSALRVQSRERALANRGLVSLTQIAVALSLITISTQAYV